MALITMSLVNRITGGDGERWTDPVVEACRDWEINTKRRVAFFLAQTAHESAGYRRLVENLKYSAQGLANTWKHRFSDGQKKDPRSGKMVQIPNADAVELAYDEYRIAERAYGGRYGNGPEGSGDGFKFRGHGLIQLTFYDNYLSMGGHLGVDLTQEPELLEQPLWAAYASAAYWEVNRCNESADADDFELTTRRVNGGTNGMEDRWNWLGVVEEAMA